MRFRFAVQVVALVIAPLCAGAATTQEEFVRIAVDWATNLKRLSELRGTLRERMKASPLMDAKGFARGIEAAYRQMWQTWINGR